ncbi:unnamed protein product [Chrysoparadoxa australica]
MLEAKDKGRHLRKRDAESKATETVMAQLMQEARAYLRHDFECATAVHRPRIGCARPACESTFVAPKHYTRHAAEDTLHKHLGDDPTFAAWHMVLCSPEGLVAVEQYVGREFGVGDEANTLALWKAAESLKALASDSVEYAESSEALVNSYVTEGCLRPVALPGEVTCAVIGSATAYQGKWWQGGGVGTLAASLKGSLKWGTTASSTSSSNGNSLGSSSRAGRGLPPYLLKVVQWHALVDLQGKVFEGFSKDELGK